MQRRRFVAPILIDMQKTQSVCVAKWIQNYQTIKRGSCVEILREQAAVARVHGNDCPLEGA